MKTIDVLHLPNSLWLGRRGENQFRPIAVKWDDWHRDYPGATLSVIYHRPDGQDFVVATSTNTPLIWTPMQDVTTVSGIGELEMHLVNNPEIGISAHVETVIDDSRSNASTVDAPAWADKVVQDVSEAASHYPQIVNGYWYVWDVESGEWVNTDVRASGGEIDPSDIADAVEDYMDAHPETDPTVPSWAKRPTKPTYTASEVGALPANTPIPAAVTEQTVAGWGFTKNTGTYSKPSGGIPKTDLASDVQTSLGKADTALQQHQSLSGYATESYVAQQIAAIPDEVIVIDIADDGSMEINGDAVTAAAVSAMILAGKSVIGLYDPLTDGDKIPLYPSFANDLGTVEFSGFRQSVSGVITNIYGSAQGTDDVLVMQSRAVRELPAVTASDNGKSLVVENGAWGKGYQAARIPRVAMASTDTTPTLDPNKLYVFPEMATLTPTLATPTDNSVVNEYHFCFDSGSTATVLTVPATILQPDGFTVEADMRYEVSILEGAMTAQGWAVAE